MRVMPETLFYTWKETSIDNNTSVTLNFLFMHKEIKFTSTTSLQHGIFFNFKVYSVALLLSLQSSINHLYLQVEYQIRLL